MNRKNVVIIFISILLLGFVLRFHNFTVWPRLGATFDEYAWTWLGLSLINNQVPTSWSPHIAYENNRKYKKYQGADFWIVTPYLEHPPFFGLVAGGFAKLNGAGDLFDISIDKIRPLAIILGVLSIGALFLLVKELYDKKTALLASLIYATVPTVAVGSRIVQNENFFIPFFLLSLFLIVKFIHTKKSLFRNLAAIICGLLIISKIPWVAAPIAIVAILFFVKKYKDAGKFLAIVGLFFLFYLFYGFYFNSEIFIDLWRLQLARYDLTFNSIFALFTEPYLIDRYMIDGWIYFGWFAFVLLLTKNIKENFVIVFGLLAYFGVFIFAIPNEPGHGWYRYPFYPFLVVSLALFIKEYFNKNLLLTFLFVVLIGSSLLELSFGRQFGFSFGIFRLFLLSTAIVLLPLFFKNKKIQRSSFVYSNLMLLFLFVLNVWAVFEYNEQ